MSFIKKTIVFLIICFALPALSALGLRAASPHPDSWREANWGPSGVLPAAAQNEAAAIYIMAARTGGLRGSVAVHSWIVTKQAGADHYMRYDVVGWGDPVRINAYPADGFWYSNRPRIHYQLHGEEAGKLIGKMEAAIKTYRYGGPEDYIMWPGPNSNTFVASILRAVPELNTVLPPEAVGRDYRPFGEFVSMTPDWRNLEVSLGGYAGFAIGTLYGLEFHLGGLVFGFDFARPGIKLPGFGRIGV